MVKKERTQVSNSAKTGLGSIDFSDTFSTTNHQNTLEEIALLIFDKSPKWVRTLFGIRNSLVKFIGLKTSIPEDYSPKFEVGGYLGFFKIYGIRENEVILGKNDSHLNFRAVIFNSKEALYNIKVTTLVEYNNAKGKIYMFLIRPFHEMVVKRMVQQAYKTN